MKRITEYDEFGTAIEITSPDDDWVLEVTNLGFDAWLHSPDGTSGIAADGKTKGEALRNLQKRLDDWLGYRRRYGL